MKNAYTRECWKQLHKLHRRLINARRYSRERKRAQQRQDNYLNFVRLLKGIIDADRIDYAGPLVVMDLTRCISKITDTHFASAPKSVGPLMGMQTIEDIISGDLKTMEEMVADSEEHLLAESLRQKLIDEGIWPTVINNADGTFTFEYKPAKACEDVIKD